MSAIEEPLRQQELQLEGQTERTSPQSNLHPANLIPSSLRLLADAHTRSKEFEALYRHRL